MRSFRDKVAAITGAASGMGRELAVELARRGCHLALSDVNVEGLEETARLSRAEGVRVTSAKIDVSDRAAVLGWAEDTRREHEQVNLIFNNAGVGLGASLEGVSYEDFEWIMGINFWGVVHGTKAFLPHLRASGEGHIINTSSVFGLVGVPGNGTYNATKFAVRGFTETLRQELEVMGAPVSATVVLPGGIQTNIARASRMSASLAELFPGDPQKARDDFEKLFMTSAKSAARTILRAVESDRRRVLVGPDAVVIDALVRLLPSAYQRITTAASKRRAKS